MTRDEFDSTCKTRPQTKRFSCYSCKYYNVVRETPGKLNGNCLKMISMKVDNYHVNDLIGCDLFEYNILTSISKSLHTIKNIAIFYFVISLLGLALFWLGLISTV